MVVIYSYSIKPVWTRWTERTGVLNIPGQPGKMGFCPLRWNVRQNK
ncbi:MAG TPA: hypothetical protein PLP19_01750 [bacterium]|nr:hypothetical protein [bacterium]HPN42190.1 hypothetical protein [bacterium]